MAAEPDHRQVSETLAASAPCRVDMGGTLDISTFAYALRGFSPCTFNAALNLRTRVLVQPYRKGLIKVSSRGFESAAYPVGRAPYTHPLGLMFAVAAYFNVGGIHISIESSSPPRSALGGSSAAAVALIGVLMKACGETGSSGFPPEKVAKLALGLEGSVAGVPCGIQDHLAAAYGGVNAWYWHESVGGSSFRRKAVVPQSGHGDFRRHVLVAYCGIPHASEDVNGTWVRQFLSGEHRRSWEEIALCAKAFVDAVAQSDYAGAVQAMNREVAIRCEMTPNVLDPLGRKLVDTAVESGCGARFTGAGGGGCLWAIGPLSGIEGLRHKWIRLLSTREDAQLMDAPIDSLGLIVE